MGLQLSAAANCPACRSIWVPSVLPGSGSARGITEYCLFYVARCWAVVCETARSAVVSALFDALLTLAGGTFTRQCHQAGC
ncbi:hypothetical protein KCP74_18020 [Salmonella enterica subsp. enterica]|nr:hypothetical protein KCP74_18020 [Salmonella enterica subsp. enterica]